MLKNGIPLFLRYVFFFSFQNNELEIIAFIIHSAVGENIYQNNLKQFLNKEHL